MFAWRNAAWLGALLITLFLIYEVGHRTRQLEEEIAGIARQVEQEQETLHVLQAEWTYLTRPTRLRKLAAKHLDMRPTHHEQLVAMETIPEILRPMPVAHKPESPNARPLPARHRRAESVWEVLYTEEGR